MYINCSEYKNKNKTICVHNMFWPWNLHVLNWWFNRSFSYCGLADTKIRIDKMSIHFTQNGYKSFFKFVQVWQHIFSSQLEINQVIQEPTVWTNVCRLPYSMLLPLPNLAITAYDTVILKELSGFFWPLQWPKYNFANTFWAGFHFFNA